MKILLVLSARHGCFYHNRAIAQKLSEQLPDVVWCSGTQTNHGQTAPEGYLFMIKRDVLDEVGDEASAKIAMGSYDLAIVDMSTNLGDNSLDFEGQSSPIHIVETLTFHGVPCIGTSLNGEHLDVLLDVGAQVGCRLEELSERFLDLVDTVQRSESRC
jgi:hypothetical protein